MLALAIAPWQFSGFWPASYDYLPQSLFSGCSALAALMLALTPATSAPRSRLGLLLAALLCWMALASPATVYWHDTLLELARVFSAAAWFWIARELLQEQFAARARLLLAAAVLGALWVALPPVVAFLRTRQRQSSDAFYNVNLYANYCAMILPFALTFALSARRAAAPAWRGRVAALGILASLFIAFGLVVSASKGGLLAMVCGCVAWLAIALRARGGLVRSFIGANRAAVLAGGVLLVLVVGAAGVKTVGPRILASRSSENHSTMFRVYTWRAAVKMISARPVTGWGAGSFPSAMTAFSETGYTRSAHQSWLQLAAESGVPALLLLAAACVTGLANGWRAARTARWSEAAAGTGCVTAFMVHACVDSGWGILSIVLLLMSALALLDSATHGDVEAEAVAPDAGGRGNLRLPWLGVVILLAAGVWVGQRASAGEDARLAAREAARRGQGTEALRLANEAVAADPLGARMYSNRAQAQESSGNDAGPDWANATRLRSTDAHLWLQWAEYRIARGNDASEQFDKAVQLAPNDSDVRLKRGEWRLNKGDAGGWLDFEHIAAQLDAPYGRYPATPEISVDMDAVRALLRLAKRDVQAKKKDQAKRWLNRVAPMLALAQEIAPQQQQMAQAMQGSQVELPSPEDLDAYVTELRALQARL